MMVIVACHFMQLCVVSLNLSYSRGRLTVADVISFFTPYICCSNVLKIVKIGVQHRRLLQNKAGVPLFGPLCTDVDMVTSSVLSYL